MSLMTGDEKHDAAATSTLDVLWVLYDRVLRVSPRRRSTTRTATGSCCPRGTVRWPTTPCSPPRGSSPSDWLAGLGDVRLAARPPPRPHLVPGVEISSGSLGHGLPLAVGTALGLRAQGIDAAVVVLVGDAELDEGSNHEAIELAGAARARPADRRRGRQPLVDAQPARGSSSAPASPRGLARRHRRRSRPRRARDGPAGAVPGTAGRGRRRGGGEVMSDPESDFAGPRAMLVDEDLSVALVYAEISGQFFGEVERRHPDRVVNVGIREQLLVNVGAGLALTGMRPGRAHVRLVPGGARLRADQARLRPPGRRRRARRARAAPSTSPPAGAPTRPRATSR